MFPHTSGSKISQRHQFHQLEPRGVRSFDVKGKQIKGEKKAIKLLETFEYLKSATTRLYDTEAKIICIVSKKGMMGLNSFFSLLSIRIFFTSLI